MRKNHITDLRQMNLAVHSQMILFCVTRSSSWLRTVNPCPCCVFEWSRSPTSSTRPSASTTLRTPSSGSLCACLPSTLCQVHHYVLFLMFTYRTPFSGSLCTCLPSTLCQVSPCCVSNVHPENFLRGLCVCLPCTLCQIHHHVVFLMSMSGCLCVYLPSTLRQVSP